MRSVDPFAYWERHASAITGLGGRERSPDPRYLFHTDYHELRAGRARFVLTLEGVRATFGELSVRVHAYKPGGEGGVSLVSGSRAMLFGEEAQITLAVPFASQAGVQYALYGYLSEDSDVSAELLHVAVDEPEDSREVIPDPPRSVLALNQRSLETRPANALLHEGRVELATPVSQSCTSDQVDDMSTASGLFGRGRKEYGGAVIARWSEALCLSALRAYGAVVSGLEGLVVGPLTVDSLDELTYFAAVTTCALGLPPPPTSDLFFDFLLLPAGFIPADTALVGVEDRWAMLAGWLARLKIGALAVVCLRYRPEAELTSSAAAVDPLAITRNEIGQCVLRLIARRYSVAPLAFAPRSELVIDDDGFGGFALVIQRI